MHFDFSTSAVALGKIAMAKAAGQPIPLGWAVDAQGNPTTDPEAALAGSLVSAGGYKGWGTWSDGRDFGRWHDRLRQLA
jgi:(2R)-3-sulfolactate dehydrogenase (NADP+)